MIKENLIKYYENSLHQNWDLPAFTNYQGETYRYKDVAKQIIQLHLLYQELGIKKGDKISLLGKNSANWAMVYLSVVTYGAVVVPILPDFHIIDAQNIIRHSDSVLLFISDQIYTNINESEMENLKAVISLATFEAKGHNKEKIIKKTETANKKFTEKFPKGLTNNDIQFDEIPNSDIGIINYTSGTTGFSKGVVLQNNSIAVNLRFATNNLPLEAGDRVVSFLPLAHTYGCAFEFLWPFSIGCHIHFLTKTPPPQLIIQAFKEVKPRIIITVPLIIEKIYKSQILPAINKKSMKFLLKMPLVKGMIYSKINKKLSDVFGNNFHEVVIGGAALNQEVELFLKKIKFPYTVGYGMTECGPLISYANWDKTIVTSAGKLIDALEVKIDSDDPYNKVGEIMVRGENVLVGYYKNEEATKQTIDKDGWLHTGDLGLINEDDFIFIRGRSKNLLLGPSGENIYPEEIEAKLNNLQFIQESVVIQKNNQLIALVYPDQAAVEKNKTSSDQLADIMDEYKNKVNNSLAKYMQISKIKIYPNEFEKTPKKNIKRFLYTGEDKNEK